MKGFLARVGAEVGDEGEAGGLRLALSRAGRPFAHVRLADVADVVWHREAKEEGRG